MQISKAQLAGLSDAEKRELLTQYLQSKAAEEATYDLTPGQRGLWLVQQLRGDMAAFNMPFSLRIRSPLQVDALKRAIDRVVQRHDSLRTVFLQQEGRLRQRVLPRIDVPCHVEDATDRSESEVRQQLDEWVRQPFALDTGPLLRVHLVSRGVSDHILLIVAHHIVIDFWSLILLQNQIRDGYTMETAGGDRPLPPRHARYREFVDWQQQLLQGHAARPLEDFWQQQMRDATPWLDLPTDNSRPAEFSFRGAAIDCHLTPDLSDRLATLATEQGVTLFSVLLTAYQVLLGRMANQQDVLVGSPFSGRSRSEFEETVGYFTNLLPLRAMWTESTTFAQLAKQVFDQTVDVLQHEELPFPRIVELAGVPRDPSRPPLVQAAFTLQKSHRRQQSTATQFQIPGTQLRQQAGELIEETFYVELPATQFELELLLEFSGDRIGGMLRYATDLFQEATAARIVANLKTLLAQAAEFPHRPLSQLAWVSAQEQDVLSSRFEQGQTLAVPHDELYAYFATAASHHASLPAVVTDDRHWTYGELQTQADRLAAELLRQGVAAKDHVAVLIERSPVLVASMLAIWKIGAVYVPLDLDSPPARLTRIVTTLSGPHLMTDTIHFQDEICEQLLPLNVDSCLSAAIDVKVPSAEATGSHLAYVIYTSGSAGDPKGVAVEHSAICNTIGSRNKELPLGNVDRVLFALPHWFDASMAILWHALTSGASAVIADPRRHADPTSLVELIQRQRVTVLPLPPRLLREVIQVADPDQLASLRHIYTGGEVMPRDLPQLVRERTTAEFFNFYGPTETAVEATWHRCAGDKRDATSIGRPIRNVEVRVLDAARQRVAIGCVGELWIGGAGLARGYLHDGALTAARFCQLPDRTGRQQRFYRTGDQARWRSDGRLEYVARSDNQVKLGGFRIELGEVEAELRQHPAIRDAVVGLCRPLPDDEPQLGAFLVPANSDTEARPDHAQLLCHLRDRLPVQMIPHRWLWLNELPRTTTGKLNRAALPWDDLSQERQQPAAVAPRNALERYLVGLWQEVLALEDVGVLDDFFDLGGSSIKAASLMVKLQDQLGQRLRVAAIFHLPNIAALAQHLAESYPEVISQRFGVTSLRVTTQSFTDQTAAADEASRHVTQPAGLIIGLQPRGTRQPLFLVHPPGGIVVCYHELARMMAPDQPVYGIRSRGLYGDETLPPTMETMAAEYVAAMRYLQPTGPYQLCGWSLGGVIAYEMAQQLSADGETIASLTLLDTTVPRDDQQQSGSEYGLELTFDQLAALPADDQLPFLWEHAQKLGVLDHETPAELVRQILDDLKRLFHHHVSLAHQYTLLPYQGQITLFRPLDKPVSSSLADDRGWRRFTDVRVQWVPGSHHTMVKSPHVQQLAACLTGCLMGGDARLS